ncbi:MAG: anti-sigma factor [Cyclobacteriaceae bacterium]
MFMSNNGCPESEKCLEIIRLVLDDEASNTQMDYLKDHIEMCMQCLDNFNVEKEIKQALREKLERKAVPQDLIDSIKTKIAKVA